MKFDRSKFFDAYRSAFGKLNESQVSGLEFLLGQIEKDSAWRSVRQLAYFMASVAHETAHTFQPIKERRGRLGTTIRKIQDRYWHTGYFGRGFIQITHKRNYEQFGIADSPERALEPEKSYEIASRGMREGIFTGKKLSDYVNAQKTDYVNARRIVNGTDKAQQIADIAERFERALRGSLVTDPAGSSEGSPAEGGQVQEVASAPPPAAPAPQVNVEKAETVIAETPQPVEGGGIRDAVKVIQAHAPKVYEEAKPYLTGGIGVSGKATILGVLASVFGGLWNAITSPLGMAFCGIAAGILIFWLYTRYATNKHNMTLEAERDKAKAELVKLQLEVAMRNQSILADPTKQNVIVDTGGGVTVGEAR